MVPALVVVAVAMCLPYIAHGPLTDAHFRMFTSCKDSWYKVPLELVNTDVINRMVHLQLIYIPQQIGILLLH